MRAKFTVPTEEEIKHDRNDFMTQRIAQIIQEGNSLAGIQYKITIEEEAIKFRMHQLGIDDDWKQTGKVNIQETFEGAPKPESMLRAELNHEVYVYKESIMRYEKLKDKFITEYKFTVEDVEKIVFGGFDWTNWQKKALAEEVSNEEDNPVTG